MQKKYFNSQDARSLINTYGFSIFPIHGVKEDGTCTCNNKDCKNVGKHPATPDGFKSATNDINKVLKLWAGRSGLNVGIATGEKSGVFVIDIDSPEAEKALYEQFDIPDTYTVKTGRGKHLYFKYDENNPIKNGANIIKGVDVRGDGGYVAGAGSNHSNGATYDTQNPLEEFTVCPIELLEFCNSKKKTPLVDQLRPQLFTNTSDGWTLEQVKEHLDCINPDVGYEEWVNVGMGLHAEGLPFHLFDEWSQKGAKYDGTARDHWKSFSAGGGVTYGTVVAYAKAGGWEYKKDTPAALPIAAPTIHENVDPETGEIAEPSYRNLPIVYAGDVTPVLDTTDFVEDLLCENQFSVIYGESNCGKTFFMLDLAMHVALGREWRGKEVEQGAVLYAALEGGNGTSNRIAAFKKHYALQDDIHLAVIPSSVNFLDAEGDLKSLLQAVQDVEDKIGNIKLIVIDTLARAISGGDENSSQDMGQMIIHADMIREITGAHISFVHHSGKDSIKGARGHSSLRAAVDTEIEISREDAQSPSTIKVVKQREIEMIEPMAFTLSRVELGENKRGKPVSSCVAIPTDYIEQARDVKLPPTQQFVYDMILNALITTGRERVVHKNEPPVVCITYDELHDVLVENGFKEVFETDTKSTATQIKSATNTARIGLRNSGKIGFNGKLIWAINHEIN